MDISLKHDDYKILKTITDNSVEECVEADFSLPEYMPEILRIVKSSAEPKIDSCRIAGDRVTVDGTCELRMIYTADDGGIYSFSQSRPFTRHCESPDYGDAVDVIAKANISYVNCRATGTKRAEIKAGVIIKVTGFKSLCEDIVSVDDNNYIQEKSINLNAMSLGCRKTKRFSMSDNIQVPAPAAFVLSAGAHAICTDIKKISNKIMVKGEAIVEICYVNADDKTQTERIKHMLPLNQILEFDGMEEHFTGDVSVAVASVDVLQKNDADNYATSFDISLGLDASITMWDEKEISVICDAYAVGAGISLKKSPFELYRFCQQIKEQFIYKDSFKISSEGISKVIYCSGEVSNNRVKYENSRLLFSGTISLSLLIKDNSGVISSLNKMLDYRFEKDADHEIEEIYCNPNVVLSSVQCSENSSDGVDCKCELYINGMVFEKISVDAVTDIEESNEKFERKNNAITVYFPDKEESLWSIARRYNTTVEAIACENDLDGETTENLKIIFIPAV